MTDPRPPLHIAAKAPAAFPIGGTQPVPFISAVESRHARRHRKLLEAIEHTKPVIECYKAARVRTLGPEDMTDVVRLRYVDGPEAV